MKSPPWLQRINTADDSDRVRLPYVATGERSARKAALLLSLGALALAIAWLWPRGLDLRPYEIAVERIRSAPERRAAFEREYECVIDPGAPIRVAFRQPGGILDNWVAIVYDPTGEVLKAREFKADWSNWNAPALQEVKALFGGDLRWAESLGGNWYRCSFT